MESLLQGIPHVIVCIDDILVSGKYDPDHLASLEMVLNRLSKAGLKLRLESVCSCNLKSRTVDT